MLFLWASDFHLHRVGVKPVAAKSLPLSYSRQWGTTTSGPQPQSPRCDQDDVLLVPATLLPNP